MAFNETNQKQHLQPAAEVLHQLSPDEIWLHSVMQLMSDSERSDFLAALGEGPVIYTNRAPQFQRPLTLHISQVAWDSPQFQKFRGSADDANKVCQRVAECLELGVDLIPTQSWLANHAVGDEMPIRIETNEWSMSCFLKQNRNRRAFLRASFVEPTGREPSQDELEVDDVDDVVDGVEAEESLVGKALPVTRPKDFRPSVRASWQVTPPSGDCSCTIDQAYMDRVMWQIAARRRVTAQRHGTRRHTRQLVDLVELKRQSVILPFELAEESGGEYQLKVRSWRRDSSPSGLVSVLQQSHGSEFVAKQVLQFVESRGDITLFRLPEGHTPRPVPQSGHLADVGDLSQIKKQNEALLVLASLDRTHLQRLADLLRPDREPDGAGEIKSPLDKWQTVNWEDKEVNFLDQKLSARQQEAVRKALLTEDLCLIQGPPGTGKTRVIAEIVRQSARRNWKVLLVAPTHVAVDNVLERIGLEDEVSPIRCGRRERLEELPPRIREFTFAQRADLLTRVSQEQSDEQLRSLIEKQSRWRVALDGLRTAETLCLRADTLHSGVRELESEHAVVSSVVDREFASELAAAERDCRSAEQSVDRCLERVAQQRRLLEELSTRLSNLTSGRFLGPDQTALESAEVAVHQQCDPLIAEARQRHEMAAAEVRSRRESLNVARLANAEAQATSSTLQAGSVPDVVAKVIKEVLDRVEAEQAGIVSASRDHLNRLRQQRELKQRQRDRTEHRLSVARRRAARLAELRGHRVRQLVSTTWWLSCVVDFEVQIRDCKTSLAEQQADIERMTAEETLAVEQLRHVEIVREQTLAAARAKSLAQQTAHWSQRCEECARDVVTREQELQSAEASQATAESALAEETERLRRCLETSREELRQRLVSEVERDHEQQSRTLADAQQAHADSQQGADARRSAKQAVVDRRTQVVLDRRAQLRNRIESKKAEIHDFSRQFTEAIGNSKEVLQLPLPMEATRVRQERQRIDEELAQSEERRVLLAEWSDYLHRNAESLRDRLAHHVNLVCATTMGIATDEYFGDGGEFEEKEFDLLIVDEAGKVTEPEFLVAAVRAKRWVLVGDHKQLPPFYDQEFDLLLDETNLRRREAGEVALDRSLLKRSVFERWWERLDSTQSVTKQRAAVGSSRCTQLNLQHRMHPALAAFVSEAFYDGQYHSPSEASFAASKSLALSHFVQPLTFCDVRGSQHKGHEIELANADQYHRLEKFKSGLPRQGYANRAEAEQVVSALAILLRDPALIAIQEEMRRVKDQGPVIGIIALYSGQVRLILNMLRERFEIRDAVEEGSKNECVCQGCLVVVDTVDAFQGKECPIVILSFTRSNRRRSVGFVDDPHRLNVALSRAQKKLILVGDSETLTRAKVRSEQQTFQRLLDHVQQHGELKRAMREREVSGE